VSPQRDVPTALVLIAFGSVVAYEAYRMPRFTHLAVNPYTVPGIVPGFLALSLVAFGLVMLLRSLLAARRARAQAGAAALEAARVEAAPGGDDPAVVLAEPGFGGRATTRLALTLLLTVGYALGLVGQIPFWLATFLFVFAFLVVFGWSAALGGRARSVLVAAALVQAVLVAASVTLVFERLFLVRLP
jgi:hypothetical protein